MEQDFVEAAGINPNPDRNCVTISTSQLLGDGSRDYQMASLAELYSQIGTGTLDVVSMRESDFVKYVDAGTFLDLRDLFTDKELSAFGHGYRDEDGKILGIYCEGFRCSFFWVTRARDMYADCIFQTCFRDTKRRMLNNEQRNLETPETGEQP